MVRLTRPSRLSQRTGDLVLAAGFAVAAAVEVLLQPRHLWWLDAPGPLLVLLVLLLRRRRPLLAVTAYAAAVVAVALVQARLTQPSSSAFVPIVVLVVLMYSLGAHGGRLAIAAGIAQPLVVVAVEDSSATSPDSMASALTFFALFVVLLPVSAGILVRRRRVLVASLRDRHERLRAAQAIRLGATRHAEAERIAAEVDESLRRELEDLVQAVNLVDASAEGLAQVEDRARTLLGRTREVVLRLQPTTLPDDLRLPATSPVTEEHARTATLVAVALCAVGLAASQAAAGAHGWAAAALLLPLPLSLVLVRRHPWLGPACVWLCVTAYVLLIRPLEDDLTTAGLALATGFLPGWLASRRAALLALGVAVGGALLALAGHDVGGGLLFVVLGWVAGRLLRDQAVLAGALREAESTLRALAPVELRRTVADQRARAARDLHDALGHDLTALALQAEAARRVLGTAPEQTEATLPTLRRLAADALAELDQDSAAAPAPDLAEVLDRGRAAGLDIDADLDAVPAGLEGVVGQVTREAVTNALRHAPGSRVVVRLRAVDRVVQLSIENDAGNAEPALPVGGGTGLTSMRHRVETAGGSLSWAATPGGGFRVVAELAAAVPA